MARFTLVLAFAAWIIAGVVHVGREMQMPVLIVYRGSIAVPILVAADALCRLRRCLFSRAAIVGVVSVY